MHSVKLHVTKKRAMVSLFLRKILKDKQWEDISTSDNETVYACDDQHLIDLLEGVSDAINPSQELPQAKLRKYLYELFDVSKGIYIRVGTFKYNGKELMFKISIEGAIVICS